MPTPSTPQAPAWRIALGLVVLYFVWGSVYLAVRTAVQFWPPFLLVGARFLVAGLLMLAWARWKEAPWPTSKRQWANASVVGLLMVTGANGGVTWGVFFVDSGLAAVLIATVPLWLIALEALRPQGDRPHWLAGVGLALGLVGVGVLVQPNFGAPDHALALWGQLILLGGAAAWAAGSIFSRQFEMPASVTMSAAIQMIVGSLALIALGALRGEAAQFPLHLAFWPSLAFLFMVFGGSLMGYGTYQWLIQAARPALVATYAYVNPVIAVFLGVWIAHEPLNASMLWGSGLILVAAFLIQRVKV